MSARNRLAAAIVVLMVTVSDAPRAVIMEIPWQNVPGEISGFQRKGRDGPRFPILGWPALERLLRLISTVALREAAKRSSTLHHPLRFRG
jgi:hypothetical protein